MLAPEVVAVIAQHLAEHAGFALPAWVVEARAAARIAQLGCSPEAYVALLDGARGGGELAELIEAVRVGESRLFRHRRQVDVLAGVVAPLVRARGRRAVRVWSAGCAAGEEPYTLALVLRRALPGVALSIVATDVSAEALAVARTARYPRAALDHVPEDHRDGFIIDGDAIRVAPEITQLVRFERANLLDGAAPRDCDLVWCRNVLIYFTAAARRRAIDRLVGATVPGGFVFVGYSESLRDIAELEAVRAGDAVYYVRRDAEPAPRPRRPTPTSDASGQSPRPAGAVAVPTPARVSQVSPIDASGEATRAAGAVGAPASHARPTPAAAGIPDLVSDDRTPPPIVFAAEPPAHDTLALRGQPVAARVTGELSARLGQAGLRSLIIDLDGADLLGDDLAPVLRRAQAAARAAGIAVTVRATRVGARRWLVRHGLAEEVAP